MSNDQPTTPDRPTLLAFWRKLAYMLSSGVPLLESIEAIAVDLRGTAAEPVLAQIKQEIEMGRTLSTALESRPDVFSGMSVSLMRVAELAGALHNGPQRIADGIENGTIEIGQAEPDTPPSAELVTETAEVQEAFELTKAAINEAIEAGASDIHIEPYHDQAKVRYRIDGVLHTARQLSPRQCALMVSRIKFMADLDVAERQRIQDGRILIDLKGQPYDLRVSVCPYAFGESAVLRILDRSAVILELDRFGLQPDVLATLDDWCHRPNGIIFVTGPTGSGKTTTLYALVSRMNREGVKLITVENPVEYFIDGVCQCEVRPSVGMTFTSILRSQLRQDPDILMVGEIHDRETLEVCVQASLTGHLVISTLHTNDAPSTLRRILDIGTEPFLINNTLIGVKAQRLCRKLCDQCKEPYEAPAEERAMLGVAADAGSLTLYRSKGCDACRGTGYRRRFAISEIFEMNDALRDAVSRRALPDEVRRIAIDTGMKTMRENGFLSVLSGVTSLAEVTRIAP